MLPRRGGSRPGISSFLSQAFPRRQPGHSWAALIYQNRLYCTLLLPFEAPHLTSVLSRQSSLGVFTSLHISRLAPRRVSVTTFSNPHPPTDPAINTSTLRRSLLHHERRSKKSLVRRTSQSSRNSQHLAEGLSCCTCPTVKSQGDYTSLVERTSFISTLLHRRTRLSTRGLPTCSSSKRVVSRTSHKEAPLR